MFYQNLVFVTFAAVADRIFSQGDLPFSKGFLKLRFSDYDLTEEEGAFLTTSYDVTERGSKGTGHKA